MDRQFWKNNSGVDEGAKARRAHSLWLTQATESQREYPRIPVRPVITGGFSRLRNRPNGSHLADRWWTAALTRVDD